MRTIKGPANSFAQFLGNESPFETLENPASWATAANQAYADEIKGVAAEHAFDDFVGNGVQHDDLKALLGTGDAE